MDSLESILDEVERLYREPEENYSAAYDLLWSTLLKTEPNPRAMLLLYLNTGAKETRQWNTLYYKYPNSPDVQRGLAEALIKLNPELAISICTEILKRTSLTRREVLDTHWARFRATARLAIRNDPHLYDILVEDFNRLWPVEDKTAGLWQPYERKALLTFIVGVHTPSAIPALQRLRDDDSLPENVRRLFKRKVSELFALEEAMQELEGSDASP